MNQSTNYKRRFIIYMIVTVVSGFIVYSMALTPTLNLNKELRKLKQNLIRLKQAPVEIENYQRKIKSLDNLIGKNFNISIDFQKSLFDKISGICFNSPLMLSEFPQIHLWSHQNYDFLTGFAKIDGRFSPLCKLLYELETNNSLGKILSVDFQTTKDPRSKKMKLSMAVYLQVIIQADHEKK